MQNKKGLSDVVTTVLIIALVLAAVAIIGAAVMSFIRSGGEQITAQGECTKIQLSVQSCTKGTNDVTLVTKWASGSDVTLSSLTLVVKDSAGKVTTKEEADAPAKLLQTAEGTVTIPASMDFAGTLTASVAAVILDASGKPITCAEQLATAVCK